MRKAERYQQHPQHLARQSLPTRRRFTPSAASPAARARGRWAAEALRLAESGSPVTPDQAARLTAHRTAYDELAEAYEALRRMVERGYISLA